MSGQIVDVNLKVKNIQESAIVAIVGGAATGKNTLIKAVEETMNCVELVSFVVSDRLPNGESCRPYREPESNRIWVDEETYLMMKEGGLILTETAVNNGGHHNGKAAPGQEGYSYLTLREFDRYGKHKHIWEKIQGVRENQLNTAFRENKLDALSARECLERCIRGGETWVIEGHSSWMHGFTEELNKLAKSLGVELPPIIVFGFVGMSEKTSEERQLKREEENSKKRSIASNTQEEKINETKTTIKDNIDEEVGNMIEGKNMTKNYISEEKRKIIKEKAKDSAQQGDQIVKMANSGELIVYKMVAINPLKFIKNRAEWIKKVVNLESRIIYLQKALKEWSDLQEMITLTSEVKVLRKELKNIRTHGIEGFDAKREKEDLATQEELKKEWEIFSLR